MLHKRTPYLIAAARARRGRRSRRRQLRSVWLERRQDNDGRPAGVCERLAGRGDADDVGQWCLQVRRSGRRRDHDYDDLGELQQLALPVRRFAEVAGPRLRLRLRLRRPHRHEQPCDRKRQRDLGHFQ